MTGKGEHQIQGFAGLGLDDVKSAVGAVVGSTDDVAGAVRFVAEHGDDIVDFIQRLPELLSSTASALTEAADDVAGAAAFLTGSPGKGDGVKAVADVAGEALDTCRTELASAQKLLASVSKQRWASRSTKPVTVWPVPPASWTRVARPWAGSRRSAGTSVSVVHPRSGRHPMSSG